MAAGLLMATPWWLRNALYTMRREGHMPTKPGIAAAMQQVMTAVDYVQKKGRNVHQKYSFAAEADVVARLHGELVKAGIVFSIVDIQDIHTETHTSGKTVHRVLAKYVAEFRHVPSGETMTACALGEGVDFGGDKASYKAATGALKYILRQTFLLATGDDPEKEPAASKPANTEAQDMGNAIADNLQTTAVLRGDVLDAYRAAYAAANGENATDKQLAKLVPLFRSNLCDVMELGGAPPANDEETYKLMYQYLNEGKVDPTTAAIIEEAT